MSQNNNGCIEFLQGIFNIVSFTTTLLENINTLNRTTGKGERVYRLPSIHILVNCSQDLSHVTLRLKVIGGYGLLKTVLLLSP